MMQLTNTAINIDSVSSKEAIAAVLANNAVFMSEPGRSSLKVLRDAQLEVTNDAGDKYEVTFQADVVGSTYDFDLAERTLKFHNSVGDADAVHKTLRYLTFKVSA